MPLQENLFAQRPAWFADALAAIGRHAFLTGSQIASFVAAHRETVLPILQNLVNDGFLQMLVPTHCPGGRPVEAAFVLSRLGAKVLRSLRERALLHPVNSTKSRYTLAHDLVRNELGVVLELLDRDGQLRLLRWETAREKIAAVGYVEERGVRRRIPLVADALAVVEMNGSATALLVEIDRGTVGMDRMLRKYRGYLAWFREDGPMRRFGTRSMRVLTVASTEARMKRLRDAAISATDGKGSGIFWFLSESAVTVAEPDKILAPVCAIAKTGDVQSAQLFP